MTEPDVTRVQSRRRPRAARPDDLVRPLKSGGWQRSLIAGLVFGLAALAVGVFITAIFTILSGQSWLRQALAFVPPAVVASLLLGIVGWRLLVRRGRDIEPYACALVGSGVAFSAHLLMWWLFLIVIVYIQFVSSTPGEEIRFPFTAIETILFVISGPFVTIMMFGWFTVLLGAAIGAVLAWAFRRQARRAMMRPAETVSDAGW